MISSRISCRPGNEPAFEPRRSLPGDSGCHATEPSQIPVWNMLAFDVCSITMTLARYSGILKFLRCGYVPQQKCSLPYQHAFYPVRTDSPPQTNTNGNSGN